jgi:endonuclease III
MYVFAQRISCARSHGILYPVTTRHPTPMTPRRAQSVMRRLYATYPDAHCSLTYSTPLELLVATILSAQCTDVRVNQETPILFRKYPSAAAYAHAPLRTLTHDLKRINFFRNKATHIKSACQLIVAAHDGCVPDTMDDLMRLPGVGRKTANVILGEAFHAPVGIVVDTHVMRLAKRLGSTHATNRDQIEQDLMRLIPRTDWAHISHVLIAHGRAVCQARRPRCTDCVLTRRQCPSYTTTS